MPVALVGIGGGMYALDRSSTWLTEKSKALVTSAGKAAVESTPDALSAVNEGAAAAMGGWKRLQEMRQTQPASTDADVHLAHADAIERIDNSVINLAAETLFLKYGASERAEEAAEARAQAAKSVVVESGALRPYTLRAPSDGLADTTYQDIYARYMLTETELGHAMQAQGARAPSQLSVHALLDDPSEMSRFIRRVLDSPTDRAYIMHDVETHRGADLARASTDPEAVLVVVDHMLKTMINWESLHGDSLPQLRTLADQVARASAAAEVADAELWATGETLALEQRMSDAVVPAAAGSIIEPRFTPAGDFVGLAAGTSELFPADGVVNSTTATAIAGEMKSALAAIDADRRSRESAGLTRLRSRVADLFPSQRDAPAADAVASFNPESAVRAALADTVASGDTGGDYNAETAATGLDRGDRRSLTKAVANVRVRFGGPALPDLVAAGVAVGGVGIAAAASGLLASALIMSAAGSVGRIGAALVADAQVAPDTRTQQFLATDVPHSLRARTYYLNNHGSPWAQPMWNAFERQAWSLVEYEMMAGGYTRSFDNARVRAKLGALVEEFVATSMREAIEQMPELSARSLSFWWNMYRNPDAMGAAYFGNDKSLLVRERAESLLRDPIFRERVKHGVVGRTAHELGLQSAEQPQLAPTEDSSAAPRTGTIRRAARSVVSTLMDAYVQAWLFDN